MAQSAVNWRKHTWTARHSLSHLIHTLLILFSIHPLPFPEEAPHGGEYLEPVPTMQSSSSPYYVVFVIIRKCSWRDLCFYSQHHVLLHGLVKCLLEQSSEIVRRNADYLSSNLYIYIFHFLLAFVICAQVTNKSPTQFTNGITITLD